MKNIPIINKKEKKLYTCFALVTLVLFIIATFLTQFNPVDVLLSGEEFWKFIIEDFLPPTLSKPQTIFNAIYITLCLAISSTFVAGILAMIFGLLGSTCVSPFPKLSKVIRGVATFLRNIPSLVWAFILFSSLGIGTGVGFVALVISTFAFMTRAFIESIDEVSTDSTEGLLVVGSSFFQRVFQGIIPSCMQYFISWFLYCIEVNIRASTIVGMVGGGGIGLVLFSYIKSFDYQTACGIILIIAGMVIAVDLLTGLLRKNILEV
ncbi:MAG: ABC transporter permease subunit [Eubacteriaceae bacterium]